MKHIQLRFLAAVMAGALLTGVPVARAAIFQDSHSYTQVDDGNKKKKKKQLPEGSTGAILVLAAGVLGGGLLVWRRKRNAATS